ncbi:hypothetical protein [Actinomadura macra]|uniref:hypothetical protein n=1 Tax=Actinomadura macra TaxID=46164 RepID=UPI0008326652|nr:hypothetical protein [Actinomadura macra]
MEQAAHAPSRPDGEITNARTVLDPAVNALTRLVHTYALAQTSAFRPDHWRGLQPDPYALRRASDALADREDLDLELTAIRIAAEAIALSPTLRRATMTTCGDVRRGVNWAEGVSWIMNAAPSAVSPAALITAYRLLTQAGAADQHLHERGLLRPLVPVLPG